MAIANGTYLENLVNPQVLADMIDKKLRDYIRFAPLAEIDYTLEGRPGNTITLPWFNLLANASAVNEGEDIPISQLTASTTTATIRKLAVGAQITDESVLSGYGRPLDNIVRQEAEALAAGVDDEMLGVLGSIASTMTFTAAASAVAPNDLNEALELFGEDIEGVKVAVVAPALHTKLRKTTDWMPASEIAADRIVRGAVGEAYGCQILVSNKLKDTGNAYIVKPGALRIFMKRGTLVETQRNIVNKSTIITADQHEVCWLYDSSKAIKVVPAS